MILQFGMFIMVIVMLALASTAFWFWMMIDCITNETNEAHERILWFLLILFTHILGSLIYFVVRYSKRSKEQGGPARKMPESAAREEIAAAIFLATYNRQTGAMYRIVRMACGPMALCTASLRPELKLYLCAISGIADIDGKLASGDLASSGGDAALVLFLQDDLPPGFGGKTAAEHVPLNRHDELVKNFKSGVWVMSYLDGRMERLV